LRSLNTATVDVAELEETAERRTGMNMKYQYLQQQLIELILSNSSLQRGGRFFSEREICEMFNISRTTARKAISALCEQGYLLREQGKGTFIKTPAQSMPLSTVLHLSKGYLEEGYHPRIDVLQKRLVPATNIVADHLKIEQGEQVLMIEKLYWADNIILNDMVTFLPVSRFPKITSVDFSTQNPMDVFSDFYGVSSMQHHNTIEAIHPPKEVADNLKISTKTPLLLFETVISGVVNARVQNLAYFKCYYKTDRFRFSYVLETRT